MSEADTTPICDRRKSADMAMTSQGPRPRPGAPPLVDWRVAEAAEQVRRVSCTTLPQYTLLKRSVKLATTLALAADCDCQQPNRDMAK